MTITGAGPQVLDLNVAPLLASVRGTVTDVDGSPYAGDVLIRRGPFPASRVTIAPDGSYAIKVLAPTTELSVVELHDPSGVLVASEDVYLVPGTTTVHDIALGTMPSASVQGIVRDETGSPVAGTQIWYCSRIGCSYATGGADGRFTIDRVPLGPISMYAARDGFVGVTAEATATTDGQVLDFDLLLRRLIAPPPTNVLYTLAEAGKRAVGFKLSQGMDVPEELSAFKFARQKSKLAGEIRGTYFVIKQEHNPGV